MKLSTFLTMFFIGLLIGFAAGSVQLALTHSSPAHVSK
jgi:hypothetical protein